MQQIEIDLNASKQEKYKTVLKQAEALCNGESNLTANLANISALLKHTFNWFWVGFYIVQNSDLVLGPFQGPVACTRIAKGKGVCGTAWQKKETIIVPNVHEFPGHIACNAASLSEIVVPIVKNEKVLAVLDVDSEKLNQFDEADKEGLENIARFASSIFK